MCVYSAMLCRALPKISHSLYNNSCCCVCKDMDLSEKMQYSSSTSSILTAILVSIVSTFDVCIKFVADVAAVSKTANI